MHLKWSDPRTIQNVVVLIVAGKPLQERERLPDHFAAGWQMSASVKICASIDVEIDIKGGVVVMSGVEVLFEDHADPVEVKKAQFKNLCKSSEKETHRMLKVDGEGKG